MRQNGFTVTLLIVTFVGLLVGILALVGASNYAAGGDFPNLAARWSTVGAFALQTAVVAFLVWLGACGVIRTLTASRIQPPPPPAS